MTVLDPHLARIAAQAFTTRQAEARRKVAAGEVTRFDAERHLLPWLAIACLAGADLPELADELADLTARDVDGAWRLPESQARGLVAARLCPRSRWAPLLGSARDAALARADAACASTRLPETERQADIAAARDLRTLAEAIGFDPNGRHHVPPFMGSIAAVLAEPNGRSRTSQRITA